VHKGFTIVEILVALMLLGVLGMVALGMVLPLRINRDTNLETRATAYARSYLELIKGRWLTTSVYEAGTLPTICKTGTCDLVLEDRWEVKVATPSPAWTVTDQIRKIDVVVTNSDNRAITFSTLVSRP
jgi:prepilin-type N-terminal cleavage/methylation domain-containing protein